MSDGVKFFGVLLLAIGFIVGAVAIFSAQSNACEDKGGHMVNLYKTRICVSEDGRILE